MDDPSQTSLKPRAFVAAPDPARYFPAAAIEESRRRISRCIDRGEGPALLIGGTGLGKSLLLEVLAAKYHNQLPVALLAGAQLCTRRALLQSILFQLGLPFRNFDEGELRISLLDYLRPAGKQARRMVLLVDEADSLPTRLLEELRVLTNISVGGQILVSLVMVGNSSLEERFAEPELATFSQRIALRCYVSMLSREETFQYVRAQVSAIGSSPDELFAQDGLEAIFSATDGVPRLVNQLGDQLIWMSEETGYQPIDAAIVQQAWSELQQLPAPWDLATPECNPSSVEFGELSSGGLEPTDESDEEHPASIPISMGQQTTKTSREVEFLETFGAAEELLDQYETLIESQVTPIAQATPLAEELPEPPPLAKDPFAEPFEEEEIVIDHYLERESQLLAGAPRVFNRMDAVFSNQIKMCEVRSLSGESSFKLEQMARVPANEAMPHSPYSEQEKIQDVAPAAQQVMEPSEILIIEDDDTPEPRIVPGRKFRQLFSSLEGAGRTHRCG